MHMLFTKENELDNSDNQLRVSANTSTKFARYIKFTDENARGFIDLISKLKKITNQSAIKIEEVVKEFKNNLKQNDIDHPIMDKYYEETSGFFQKLAKWNMNFSLMLENNYVQPFRTFLEGIYSQSLKQFKGMEDLIYDLTNSKKDQKSAKESYYQMSRNVEKGEENLNNLQNSFEKGKISRLDLNKETEKAGELKIFAEEERVKYEDLTSKLQVLWKKYDDNFVKTFADFDVVEESRIDFTKKKCKEITYSIKDFQKHGSKALDNVSGFKKIDENDSGKLETTQGHIGQTKFLEEAISKGYGIEEYTTYERYKLMSEQRNFDEDFFVIDTNLEISEKNMDYLQTQHFYCFNMLSLNSRQHIVNERSKFQQKTTKQDDQNQKSDSIDSKTSKESKKKKGVFSFLRKNKESDEKSEQNLLDNSCNESTTDEEKDIILNNGQLNGKILDSLFSSSICRERFLDDARKKLPTKVYYFLLPKENVEYLSQVLRSIITGQLKDHERSAARFIDILKLISAIYYKDENDVRVNLYESFRGSILWKDIALWNESYNYLLKEKKELEQLKQKEKKTIFGMGMKIFKEVSKAFTPKHELSIENEEIFLKHDTQEVQNFFQINLNIDLDMSTEILAHLAREHNIQANFYANLVDQLESSYHTQDMKRLQHKKRERNQIRQNKWGRILPIKLATNYLDDEKDFAEQMLVCKEWRQKLQPVVTKRLLFDPNRRWTIARRRQVWKFALRYSDCEREYYGERSDNLELPETLEDVINMDVLRSFPNHKNFNPKELTRVLRSIAFTYSDGASYCQGMNYLAGLFQLQFNNDEIAFKMFAQLLEQKMMGMFTTNFDELQRYFYVLDKIVALHIPQQHDHFKVKNTQLNIQILKITPVFYSSSWFITQFTNALQYTERSPTVLMIMDIFMAQGFKGLLKVIIVIQKHYKARFLKMSFDEIMNHMSDLTKREIFTCNLYTEYKHAQKSGISPQQLSTKYGHFMEDFNFIENFKEKAKLIEISNQLVLHLETKYDLVSYKLKKRI